MDFNFIKDTEISIISITFIDSITALSDSLILDQAFISNALIQIITVLNKVSSNVSKDMAASLL